MRDTGAEHSIKDGSTANEVLFTAGVLTTRRGEVTTTDRFESTVDKYTDDVTGLSTKELVSFIQKHVRRERLIGPFVDLCSKDQRTIAELCALQDHLESTGNNGVVSDTSVLLLPVLRLFRSITSPLDDVPQPFIPVPASHIPHLTRVYSPVVVYIWLDDCPPCDILKTDLESIFENSREVMPFAVYGPDHQDVLADEFEVTAGPALLFMRDGAVDSRLYGAQDSGAIEAELGKLRESYKN
ncbi:thioredoxin family protein [Halegenticoccus tardaugens]|uniref:thioredoxin family protein n=1 Tax=Halegenticoccus tardaugens TaxID=2071624 RepID=UPI00100BE752|nr:thioredoxin family protein [Halegenticoccus tardaugens]